MPNTNKKWWTKKFNDEIFPILENPLYEYNFSEGHEESKKCTEKDVQIIEDFISLVESQTIRDCMSEIRKLCICGDCNGEGKSPCGVELCEQKTHICYRCDGTGEIAPNIFYLMSFLQSKLTEK